MYYVNFKKQPFCFYREQEEDRDLENVMKAKGFSLSPTSGSKILRKHRSTTSEA